MATRKDRKNRERRYSNAREVTKSMDTGFKPTSFKVPDGMKVFRFEEEKVYKIDIIPYTVGEGNPNCEQGLDHFERTYFAHRNVGPSNDTIVCLNRNFGKKCPNCEAWQRIKNDPEGDDELEQNLRPKRRQLWYVYDYDNPDDGIQIMETGYYKSFGEILKEKLDASEDEDEYINFHHVEGGMTLKVSCKEDTFKGKTFYKPTNIEMKKRKSCPWEDLLEDLPSLDELLIELPYKEFKEKMLAVAEDDDEEEEDNTDTDSDDNEEEDESPKSKKKDSGKSSKKQSKKSSEEEDEDDDEDNIDPEEYGCDVGDVVSGTYKGKKFKGKVTKLVNGLVRIRTEDGDIRTMDPDEISVEEPDEDEDESPKKSKKSSTSSKKASKPSDEDDEEDEDDEDEDDDEEEEEDEEPVKSKSKSKASKSKKSKKEDEDEDDEEEDEDEEDEEEDEDEEDEDEEEDEED